MKPVLLPFAAGIGSRYGGLRQLGGLGPNGGTIMDCSVCDAIKAGFDKIVFVIREDFGDEFRERVLSKCAGHVPAEVCFQPIDKLLKGFTVSEDGEKPWGTSHAVMIAEELISEPFCVINCDDFYNRDAFMVMEKFLANLPEGSKNNYAMVGFHVGNTLSENGAVARGICEKGGQGDLTTVVEHTEIMRASGAVCYKDEQGEWVAIDDSMLVSVNMWGFILDYFKCSDVYLKEFLSGPRNVESLKAELFIPLMVNRLTQEGMATVKVFDTTSKWLGVTYAADRQDTVDRIQSLVGQDTYPNQLF